MRPFDQRALVALAIVLVAGSILLMRRPRRETLEAETHIEVEEGGAAPPIRIGVMSTMESTDPEYRLLARLAEDEINEYCNESGVEFRFEFVFTCARGTAANSRDLTEQYHLDGVDLVIGYGWLSFLCSGTRPYAEENGMLLISPSSSQPWPVSLAPTAYRLSPHDCMYATPTARAIESLGITNVVVLQRGDMWADGVLASFRQEYGGTVVEIRYPGGTPGEGFEEYVGDTSNAVNEAIDEVGSDRTAVLYLGYSEADDILQEVSRYPKLMNVTWFSAEAVQADYRWWDEMIIDDAITEAAKVRLIGSFPEKTDTDEFRRVDEAYTTEFGEPLCFQYANIYDACWLMALSVIEAESANGREVSAHLPVVAADYIGITGYCRFNDWGDRSAVNYDLWRYFEVEGELRCLRCGLYNCTTDSVTWDEELIPVIQGEAG